MGKTAVFVLSVLQQIEPVAGQVAALVLCHTRELAYQVFFSSSRPCLSSTRYFYSFQKLLMLLSFIIFSVEYIFYIVGDGYLSTADLS